MDNKTYKNLPLYKLSIEPDDNAWVDGIGLVDKPAIGVNSLFFSKLNDKSEVRIEVENTKLNATKQTFSNISKQEILGAAMIPDKPMFRPANDVVKHDHYVAFTAEEIRKIARVFFDKGCQNNINIGHTSTTASSNTFISYFIDKSIGISTPQGMDELPDGTWVVGMYVQDKSVYDKLIQSDFGMSVEGLFSYSSFSEQHSQEPLTATQKQLNECEEFIKSILK
jgi:hypothetical protein